MKKLRTSRAALGLSCLVPFVADVLGGEFRLLERHSETRIDRIETFVAADVFNMGGKIGGRTLSAVGLNFQQHFLGVVEHNVPETHVSAWTLLYTVGDKSLIDVSGGEEKTAVPFLAYIHRSMEMGETGPSHLDWRSNIAYMRSPVDRRLWAVHWSVNYANEWNIGAVYVPHAELDWRSGSRFFTGAYCAAGVDTPAACRDAVGGIDVLARAPQTTK